MIELLLEPVTIIYERKIANYGAPVFVRSASVSSIGIRCRVRHCRTQVEFTSLPTDAVR